jgi:UDP-N-acetyl-2-amino-2-deoxyglucuronate dehydrogenase
MSEKVGFAILGVGMVADYHRRAIAANTDLGARLVAVGHYNPARFAEIGVKFGVPCVGQEALLADPAVDVVCICTPSGQHAAQAIEAAAAGKHVNRPASNWASLSSVGPSLSFSAFIALSGPETWAI